MRRIKENHKIDSFEKDFQARGSQRSEEGRNWLSDKVKDYLERKLVGLTSEEECTFCHKRVRRKDWPSLIHVGLQRKYANSMNYYFMKGVNDILNGEKTSATIQFRDDAYWDMNKEFVVGYYRGKQVGDKFHNLWKYHQFNIDQPRHKVSGVFRSSETYFNEKRKIQEKAIKKMLQVMSDSEIENCEIHLSHFIGSNSIFVEDARQVGDRVIPKDLDKQKISIPSLSVIESKAPPSSRPTNFARLIHDPKHRRDSEWDMGEMFGKEPLGSAQDWPSFLDSKDVHQMNLMRSESRKRRADPRVPKLGLSAAAKKNIIEASKKLLSGREGRKPPPEMKKQKVAAPASRDQLKVRSEDFLQQLTQMMTPRTKLRTESSLFHTVAHPQANRNPAKPKQSNKSLSKSKELLRSSAAKLNTIENLKQAFASPHKTLFDQSQSLKKLVQGLRSDLKSPSFVQPKEETRKRSPMKKQLLSTPQKVSEQLKLKASSVKSLIEKPKSMSKEPLRTFKKLQEVHKKSKKGSLNEKSANSINLFFKPSQPKKCKASVDGRRDKPEKKLKERPRQTLQPSLSKSTVNRLPTSDLNLLFANPCSSLGERFSSNIFDRPNQNGTKVNIYSSDFMHTIILSKRKRLNQKPDSPKHSQTPDPLRELPSRLDSNFHAETSLKNFTSPISKSSKKEALQLHKTTKTSPQLSAREKFCTAQKYANN